MTSLNYCTYITIYSGNKLPPFYIGSTSIKRIEEGYRGSVSSEKFLKTWKQELRNNPQLFKTKIITQHSSREEAYIKENRLQKILSVDKNPLYMNQSIAREKSFYRYSMNSLIRDKISNTLSGKPKSLDHAKNISAGKKGISTRGSGFKDSPESNIKRSLTMTGRPQPRHTCPHCNLTGGNAMTRWHFDNCKFKSP